MSEHSTHYLHTSGIQKHKLRWFGSRSCRPSQAHRWRRQQTLLMQCNVGAFKMDFTVWVTFSTQGYFKFMWTVSLTYLLAKTTAKFFRDTLSNWHSGNTPWLGAANFAFNSVSCFGKVLSDLSCLSRSSLTNNYQCLIIVNSLQSHKKTNNC